VIYSHYWMSGIAAISLKEKWNIPILHMFHTLSQLKSERNYIKIEEEGEYRIQGEQKVMDSVDRIIVATDDEVSKMKKFYNIDIQKLVVIPPGVDTCHFYPIPTDEAKAVIGVPKSERMILYVGRIEPLKGVDKLIRAIAELHKGDVFSECPHYLIIIGGDPDAPSTEMNLEMQRLQQLSKDLNVSDLVIFLGKRNQDTLPYYYSAAEIVVVPSHYESFGMVALEAMACGTPVIATQVGGLSFLIKDNITGYTIPDDNQEALEQSLTQLICKDDIRKQMSLNSIVYAQLYSWDKITPKIIMECDQLVKSK
jgi:D-inositol-3-phosphate glycosyltransferase